ncbi:hypothetical protein RBB50_008773 [Rhinocladiella similis]
MDSKPGLEGARELEIIGTNDEEAVPELSHAAQKRLMRKIDLRLIPMLFVLFLLAFIDRVNIGNAKVLGIEKELGLHGNQFNIALFIFFLPFVVLEVPANLILRHVKPQLWLGLNIFLWGIVTIGQGFCKSFGSLIACRVLLGVFEAGFYPGCIYVISMYYRRHQMQFRVNIFFSASILAGAFSGLLAYGISFMHGVAGHSGWRWIFILEGTVTSIMALVSLFVLPDWPEKASFLTSEERTYLLHRLAVDAAAATMNVWTKKTAHLIFGDVKIYLGALMYMGIATTSYSTSFFAPTVIHQLGYSAVNAQLMAVPVFVVAAVISISVGFMADHIKHRFGFIMLGCFVATVGYAIMLSQHTVSVGARYFALFAIAAGGFISQPIAIVWLSNNLAGHYKRAVGSAVQIGLGNASGLIASNIFLPAEAPEYPAGYGTSFGLVWLCGISAIAMLALLYRENHKRDKGERDYRLELSQEEVQNMGDHHPAFRFTY